MRKFVLMFVLGILLVFPFSASAQTDVALQSVTVQLWPEYDQPSMLVIVDFKVAPMTPLPLDLMFNLPADANLIAVAFQTDDGNLLNANYTMISENENGQTFSISVDQNVTYRYEYYQPLKFDNMQREFSYVWDNAYAVKNFSVNVLEPLDVVSFSTTPVYVSQQVANGLNYYAGDVFKLSANQPYTFEVQYTKTTNTLVNEPQTVQPAQPVNEDTPGRISLSNSYPYLIAFMGVGLILGGIVYYWRTGRVIPKRYRRRRIIAIEEEGVQTGTYCPQCGARAKSGDKFCRTCGTKLRKSHD